MSVFVQSMESFGNVLVAFPLTRPNLISKLLLALFVRLSWWTTYYYLLKYIVEGFPKLSNTSFLTEVGGGLGSFSLDSPSIVEDVLRIILVLFITRYIAWLAYFFGYLSLNHVGQFLEPIVWVALHNVFSTSILRS